ncbi:MAG: cytidylate kinase-like family protein [Clostridia bacterium]|nr:cytidylate kinase-like family protein [Clostridia bacterium]
MSNRIITISREFGSGGRTIGRMAAEKLGIPCYDQEIIEKIAEETGMLKSYVESNVEDVQGGWLSILAGRDYYGHSLQDDLHTAQTKVIRELADKSACVIIGRCADSILSDYDNLLKVFIHASMEKRVEWVLKQYGETEQDPIQRLKEKDKKRKAYYQLYSDHKWGAMENYHVALDSGVLGVERCAEIIVQLF